MPGDERDDVGAPNDGHGQAKPPMFPKWVNDQIRGMEAAHERILDQWAAMSDRPIKSETVFRYVDKEEP